MHAYVTFFAVQKPRMSSNRPYQSSICQLCVATFKLAYAVFPYIRASPNSYTATQTLGGDSLEISWGMSGYHGEYHGGYHLEYHGNTMRNIIGEYHRGTSWGISWGMSSGISWGISWGIFIGNMGNIMGDTKGNIMGNTMGNITGNIIIFPHCVC